MGFGGFGNWMKKKLQKTKKDADNMVSDAKDAVSGATAEARGFDFGAALDGVKDCVDVSQLSEMAKGVNIESVTEKWGDFTDGLDTDGIKNLLGNFNTEECAPG